MTRNIVKPRSVDYSPFLFLIGGAFQGKSLISIKLAERYSFSGIISTDLLRNVLRVVNPSDAICRPTSKCSQTDLRRQTRQVSMLLKKVLGFYSERGERYIIEGIHFDPGFLKRAIDNGAACICLDNKLPWRRRVILKMLTTPVMRFLDPVTGVEHFTREIDPVVTKNISYFGKRAQYEKAHKNILYVAKKFGIKRISFRSFDEAMMKIHTVIGESVSRGA